MQKKEVKLTPKVKDAIAKMRQGYIFQDAFGSSALIKDGEKSIKVRQDIADRLSQLRVLSSAGLHKWTVNELGKTINID